MLTLITGSPGAGKTAYVVAQLQEFVRANPARPVFVMGIPELLVPHELTPPVEQWTCEVKALEDDSIVQTEFTFPEGALVVIDEAQKVFRPRGVGSRVPGHVAAFETHRHVGIDFWLITQHPNLIDANIRKLVRKHVHLRQHWAGRELCEWSEAVDPLSKAERASAVRRPYRLPKAVFGQYKSASLHVETKQRVPWMAWVFVALVGVVGVLGWRIYGTVSSAVDGEHRVEAARMSGAVSHEAASQPRGVVVSLEAFRPRLVGRPESAPIYDELRKVVAMPAVAGCMASRSRCSCVTEQGSNAGLSEAECRAWLAAPPFSPFRQVFPERPAADARAPAAGDKHVTP